MTEMIDKIARAMHASVNGHVTPPPTWDNQSEQSQNYWRIGARAAIVVMREPTGAMYMAGGIVATSAHLADKDYKPYGTRTIGDMAAKAAWETMIDAALEDE
jgi:hypothetical protein